MGQQIGLTGNTGNAVSMRGADQHLHFELRTMALPPRGLAGRFSPMAIFGECPLHEAVPR
jgi:murein DD-endopeptidase MepM/ murein hydrolase activator NlpD